MQRQGTTRNNRRAEDNRKRRFCYRVLFAVIALLIVIFDLIFLIQPDREVSETENRTLQQFPKLNFTTLTNGKFESLFDNYVADQFPARDGWVNLKSTVDRFAGKTENRGIYLGKDGYLIQDMKVPSEEAYAEKMGAIRALREANPNVEFTALIAPTALSVLKDHLPANAPAADEDALLDRVSNDLTAIGVRFTDTRKALKEAAEQEQVYYRTDHHWTTFGAHTAYLELAKMLSLPGSGIHYQRKLVSDSFRGTLSSSSGFRAGETDPIEIFLPETEQNYSVTYVGEGKKTATFYAAENLDVKDQYTVFFNGNHPQIKIETAAAGTVSKTSASDKKKEAKKRVLLVLKDSYANCFVPFLAADFPTILMVDPRYYTDDLNQLIQAENVTDILYLYNIQTFTE